MVLVPYIFHNLTGASPIKVPARELDDNFQALQDAINAGVGGRIPPYCLDVTVSDGAIYVPAPLVSTQMWTIRDVNGVYQTPAANTIDFRLDSIPPGIATIPQLTARVPGFNLRNNFKPQCVGTWTIALNTDPYVITLVGSDYGDGMSCEGGGIVYVPGSLIDASPELTRAAQFCRAHGGGTVRFPANSGIYLQSNPFYFVENTTYYLNGSYILKADSLDQLGGGFAHSIAPLPGSFNTNTSKARFKDGWIYDNGQFSIYGAGDHAIEGGSSVQPLVLIEYIEFDNINIRDAGGYGGSLNNNNGCYSFTKKNGTIKYTQGDSWDRKNTLNSNNHVLFFNEVHDHHALGSIGTDSDFVRGEPNPFRSLTIGTANARMTWRRHGFHTNDRVIITNAVNANGVTVPATPITISAIVTNDQFTVPLSGSSLAVANWGGNAVQLLKCIPVDGLITVSGETRFKMLKTQDPNTHIGEIGTFAGATAFNALTLVGSFPCVDFDDTYFYFESGTFTLMGSNPFTPASIGSTVINCTFPGYDQSAGKVRFRNQVGGSGCSVAKFVSYTFTVISSSVFSIDLADNGGVAADDTAPFGGPLVEVYFGTGASGSGSGGGSVMTYVCPHISTGDRITDSRGLTISLNTIRARGRLAGRNGIYQRGGIPTTTNGVGGYDMTVFDYTYVSEDPDWMRDVPDGKQGGNAITLTGRGAKLDHIVVKAPNIYSGINIAASAENAKIGAWTVEGCQIAVDIAGDRTQLKPGHAFNPKLIGVRIWGNLDTITFDDNPHNPFTPVAVGSSLITVLAAGWPSVNKVGIAGTVNGSGCTIVGSNAGRYTIINTGDPNSFRIDLTEFVPSGPGSVATLPDSFGGDNVTMFFGSTPHDATDTTIDGVNLENTEEDNTAIAIANGTGAEITQGQEGRAVRTSIRNTTQVGFFQKYTDKGSGTIWGPGNIGLRNDLVGDTSTIATLASGFQLVETITLSGNLPAIDVGGLAAYEEVFVQVFSASHSNGSNQNFGVQLLTDGATVYAAANDYSWSGNNLSTANLLFCSAVAAATTVHGFVRVRNFNKPLTKSISVRGGTRNSAAQFVNSAARFEHALACSGIRLLCGGAWSAGTAYVWGR